tara:strand:+ start:1118 stop:1978 length:861 start_codon:yes stop_codon:yes gene_type:complete
MITRVTKSKDVRDNIVFSSLDENKDLTQDYLDFNIVVIDDFITKNEIAILQDSQVKNANNYDVGKKMSVTDLIKKPSRLFRNEESSQILKNMYLRLSEFSIERYGELRKNLVISYFQNKLRGDVKPDQFNLRFRDVQESEDMHLDRYSFEPLRIFVNLDSMPRVWRTSYDQIECMSMLSRKKVFATSFDGPVSFEDIPDRSDTKETKISKKFKDNVNGKINSTILYDYEKKENLSPYHEIEFGSGSIWIVNTKRVSHQLVSGKRVGVFSRFYPALQLTSENLPDTL